MAIFKSLDIGLLVAINFTVFIINIYIVFNTRLIVTEKRYGITNDDYIFVALILYFDFINSFVYTFRILIKNK